MKSERTMGEITSKYGVHSKKVENWKGQLKESIADIFSDKHSTKTQIDQTELIQELYQKIGQLEIGLDWLKKNRYFSNDENRLLMDPDNDQVCIARQCELSALPNKCGAPTSPTFWWK